MKKWIPILVFMVILTTTMACSFSFGLPNLRATPQTRITSDAPGGGTTVDESTPLPSPQFTPAGTAVPFEPGDISSLRAEEQALVELYQYASQGVVLIQTYTAQGGGQGSGFVIDKDGHIVTNYHVVEGAEDLEIDFPSGFKARGEVIGTDLDSDLAVIRVDAPEELLFPLPMGDSDELQVGQTVVAIGNPFGLSGTLTKGIVSAKGRTLESLRTSSSGNAFSAGDIIQTDASINPGNSGGPLLNLDGEVVGVNRAIRTTGITAQGEPINSGIGFAISINIVKRVVPYLIEFGYYDYPYLGISAMSELSLVLREELGINRYTGAYITLVEPGSPADQAGLRAGTRPSSIANLNRGGDLIIGVDGREVLVFGDLLSYLMTNKSPGDEIVLTIVRDGEEMEVPLTLGKRP
ncbi:MAG TPA: PDZ domain-containing protein [Chloroflexi bacterium]|jgi:2-alkenal reductase|nr:PDZ domain-containing protein [Chloroflexota bacterium]HPO58362.1 trypsin-like peptidase domain-containing protein [Anaerolineaceae bacterium]